MSGQGSPSGSHSAQCARYAVRRHSCSAGHALRASHTRFGAQYHHHEAERATGLVSGAIGAGRTRAEPRQAAAEQPRLLFSRPSPKMHGPMRRRCPDHQKQECGPHQNVEARRPEGEMVGADQAGVHAVASAASTIDGRRPPARRAISAATMTVAAPARAGQNAQCDPAVPADETRATSGTNGGWFGRSPRQVAARRRGSTTRRANPATARPIACDEPRGDEPDPLAGSNPTRRCRARQVRSRSRRRRDRARAARCCSTAFLLDPLGPADHWVRLMPALRSGSGGRSGFERTIASLVRSVSLPSSRSSITAAPKRLATPSPV